MFTCHQWDNHQYKWQPAVPPEQWCRQPEAQWRWAAQTPHPVCPQTGPPATEDVNKISRISLWYLTHENFLKHYAERSFQIETHVSTKILWTTLQCINFGDKLQYLEEFHEILLTALPWTEHPWYPPQSHWTRPGRRGGVTPSFHRDQIFFNWDQIFLNRDQIFFPPLLHRSSTGRQLRGRQDRDCPDYCQWGGAQRAAVSTRASNEDF